MIFKRFKHPLPKFPAQVRSIFRNACEPLPVDQARSLGSYVDKCIAELQVSLAEKPTLDIDMAKEIADVCTELLDRYDQFNKKQQSLVVGAVRYFAIAEDPFPDETFASGFDDDARVVNHVLERLGMDEYYIDVPN